MTKKQFKKAMQRGLGRCILALDGAENLEKHRAAILYGCTHNLGYDTQCEGTRADYIYEMVKLYPDTKPFLNATVKKFKTCSWQNYWDFNHLYHLLALFYSDGYQIAWDALWEAYDKLYAVLKTRKRVNRYFFELDHFEWLAMELVDFSEKRIDSYLKIAEDIGNLQSLNPKLYHSAQFDSFIWHCDYYYGADKCTKALKERAKTSQNVAVFLSNAEKCRQDSRERKREIKESRAENKVLPGLTAEEFLKDPCQRDWRIEEFSTKSYRENRAAEILKIAQAYVAEKDMDRRINLLKFFEFCPFPLSSQILIDDAESENQNLSMQALDALKNVRDEAVFAYIEELLQDKERICDGIQLLAGSYRKEDREIFCQLVKSIPINQGINESGWHSVFFAVQDMFKDRSVKDAPKELLPYMYENTLCSCCRERTLELMSKRRMLTDEILKECLYDSNSDIREYAQKLLKRRK